MATPPKRGRATVGVVVRVFGPISVLMLALASLGCLLLLPVGAQATQTAPPRIKPYEDVVALLDTHVARSHPKLDSKPVASVRATRPLTGQRTVLPALGHSIDSAGRLWLRIRLPGRALGSFRPFVVGIAFGAAWSPCVGPLLAAALTVASRSGQAGKGALLLVAYAFGIGVPFMLAALGLASWPALGEWLRRAGPTIERVAGVLLVALGVLLPTGVYSHLTSYLARFTPAFGGL